MYNGGMKKSRMKWWGVMGVFLVSAGLAWAGMVLLWERGAVEMVEVEVEVETMDERVEKWLSQMSLREKVGQMIIMTNEEQSLTGEFLQELREVRPGGYILMVPNITTFAQTRKMLQDIDELSRREFSGGVPMILAVDEEGGNVQRLLYVEDKEATNVPYMYDLGQTGDEVLAYEIGQVIGTEMRSLGLNLTFAPVVDVFSNSENEVIGRRSFSEDKDVVARMAAELAAGIESVGVGTVYKHFPGHGDTVVDSHEMLPVVGKSWEELEEVELYPFRRAIEAGVEMIMVGHIAVGGGEEPASLSYEAVTGVLRGRLGFAGLAVTDALNMGAVTENYTGEEIAVKAVAAGNDLLLMPEDARGAQEAIVNAVERGEIEEERINEAVRKILKYKFERLEDFVMGSEEEFGSEAHKAIVQRVGGGV